MKILYKVKGNSPQRHQRPAPVDPRLKRMNLVIDIGNSRTKTAILSGGEIVERWTLPELDREGVKAIIGKYPGVDRSILSSTRAEQSPGEEYLAGIMPFFMRLDRNTPIPLKNLYRTPHTLGPDRLAAAVGAYHLYPGNNLMIVDLGTAITIDFVTSKGEYLGGSISPGARLRFKSLRDHTDKLPYGTLEDAVEEVAGTTGEAIANGIVNGISYEITGYQEEFSAKMPGLKVILTGGDADFFEKRLKNTIFANYDLVISGLNTILDYNAPEQNTI